MDRAYMKTHEMGMQMGNGHIETHKIHQQLGNHKGNNHYGINYDLILSKIKEYKP